MSFHTFTHDLVNDRITVEFNGSPRELLSALGTKLGITIPPDYVGVYYTGNDGRKISAIKAIRALLNTDLRASKNIVESNDAVFLGVFKRQEVIDCDPDGACNFTMEVV